MGSTVSGGSSPERCVACWWRRRCPQRERRWGLPLWLLLVIGRLVKLLPGRSIAEPRPSPAGRLPDNVVRFPTDLRAR